MKLKCILIVKNFFFFFFFYAGGIKKAMWGCWET